jgi:hypothetical protein
LCRAANLGVAPWTLRRWCAAEGIQPARLLDLARLLSALILATKRGAVPIEWLDLDPRTYCAMLARTGVADLLVATELPTPAEFVRLQRLVCNPVFLDALASALARPERKGTAVASAESPSRAAD